MKIIEVCAEAIVLEFRNTHEDFTLLKRELQTLVQAGIFSDNTLELLVTVGKCIGTNQT